MDRKAEIDKLKEIYNRTKTYNDWGWIWNKDIQKEHEYADQARSNCKHTWTIAM